MDKPYRDGWLVVIGLLYPLVAFGVLVGCGPFAIDPFVVPMPAQALAVAAVVARLVGVKLRWLSVALFALWLGAVTVGVWMIMAAASASV